MVAGAETLILTRAFFTPLVEGLNVTFTVQLAPAARPAPLIGQLTFVRANWVRFVPPRAIPVMMSGAVPVLVTVTVWGAVAPAAMG